MPLLGASHRWRKSETYQHEVSKHRPSCCHAITPDCAMLEPYSYTPRRESGFRARSRSETTIAEVAHQTCYSAAEVIAASADPAVRARLDRCQHILFEDWGSISENPADWPQDADDAEQLWVWNLLQLCISINAFQKTE